MFIYSSCIVILFEVLQVLPVINNLWLVFLLSYFQLLLFLSLLSHCQSMIESNELLLWYKLTSSVLGFILKGTKIQIKEKNCQNEYFLTIFVLITNTVTNILLRGHLWSESFWKSCCTPIKHMDINMRNIFWKLW